jgi:hypothetical protein
MQIYFTEPDREAYARTAKDPDEILAFLAGTTSRWAFGQCQTMKERMTLCVPAANSVSTNVPRHAKGAIDLNKVWIRSVTVHEGRDTVLVTIGRSVYGYSLEDGRRIASWEGLHSQHVSKVCQGCCGGM